MLEIEGVIMGEIGYRYYRLAVILLAMVLMMDIAALGRLSFVWAEEEPQDGGEQPVEEEDVLPDPPKQVTIKSITSTKECEAVIKWKKTDCTRYKIQYSQDKNFKSSVGKATVAYGKTSLKVKKLAKGKRYYFRIRAQLDHVSVVTGDTVKLNGVWSDVKSVKVHKHSYKLDSYLTPASGVEYTACYKCSCGKSYYKSKTKAGKIYDGIITRMPSCLQGILKATPTSSNKYIPAVKTHVCVEKNGKNVCSRCGMRLNYIDTEYVDEENGTTTNTVFTAPRDTNQSASMALSVKNQAGETLKYKLYYQKSSSLYLTYPKYKSYIASHGCSTCALTTVLNATVPKYKNYTPDMVIEKVIRPVVGEKAFKKNFSKSPSRQMPIGLKGITKVLKANGVRCKYVHEYTKKSAQKEIKEHLKSGNPVIFTLSYSFYCSNNHTMCMLGLDDRGQIIVGDSIRSTAGKWGKYNRLVKFNTKKDPDSSKIKNVCKYFKYSLKDASKVGYYYDGKKGNIGYVLVWKDGEEADK